MKVLPLTPVVCVLRSAWERGVGGKIELCVGLAPVRNWGGDEQGSMTSNFLQP